MRATYKGKFIVHFKDNVKHEIVFPMFKLSGTLMGERKLKYKEMMLVTDLKNDLIASINMEPESRGLFSRVFSKKSSVYPDYFKYYIITLEGLSRRFLQMLNMIRIMIDIVWLTTISLSLMLLKENSPLISNSTRIYTGNTRLILAHQLEE